MIDILVLLLHEIDSDDSIHVMRNEYTVSHPLVNAAKYIAVKCKNLHKDTRFRTGRTVYNGCISEYIILSRGIITYSVVFPRYV